AFGFEGLDVSKPAETWMQFEDPAYYLPQHGTRPVNKDVGSIALFGSMDESIATPALARLAANTDSDQRNLYLWLLAQQATAESDAAVEKLIGKLTQSLDARVIERVTERELIEARPDESKTTREEFVSAMNKLVAGDPDAWIDLTINVP